mmetsp:Transcript_137335/g.342461  ORF Transcript_137335/g.342461 Transcript_137335/m.342461 type:complete len:259 (+) Transcript_137335:1127-1903(+)
MVRGKCCHVTPVVIRGSVTSAIRISSSSTTRKPPTWSSKTLRTYETWATVRWRVIPACIADMAARAAVGSAGGMRPSTALTASARRDPGDAGIAACPFRNLAASARAMSTSVRAASPCFSYTSIAASPSLCRRCKEVHGWVGNIPPSASPDGTPTICALYTARSAVSMKTTVVRRRCCATSGVVGGIFSRRRCLAKSIRTCMVSFGSTKKATSRPLCRVFSKPPLRMRDLEGGEMSSTEPGMPLMAMAMRLICSKCTS